MRSLNLFWPRACVDVRVNLQHTFVSMELVTYPIDPSQGRVYEILPHNVGFKREGLAHEKVEWELSNDRRIASQPSKKSSPWQEVIVATRIRSMQVSCKLHWINTLVSRKHYVGAYLECALVCQFNGVNIVPACASRSLVVDHGVVFRSERFQELEGCDAWAVVGEGSLDPRCKLGCQGIGANVSSLCGLWRAAFLFVDEPNPF